jgi:hypothetical protein
VGAILERLPAFALDGAGRQRHWRRPGVGLAVNGYTRFGSTCLLEGKDLVPSAYSQPFRRYQTQPADSTQRSKNAGQRPCQR